MLHSFYCGLWIQALCLVQSFISIKVRYVRPACGCESICKGILWGKLQSMTIEWESQSLMQKTGSQSLTSSQSRAVIVLYYQLESHVCSTWKFCVIQLFRYEIICSKASCELAHEEAQMEYNDDFLTFSPFFGANL